MGLTSAMYTGLTGMNVNQSRIDTIGNNLANVNTTAFKNSRTLFQTQFSRTLSLGTAPSNTSGGTNPMQFGLGALVGSTQRNFGVGAVETTGVASDLAIEGDGFFVLRRPNGQQAFTRDGSFSVSPDNRLVTIDGDFVQGFGVDENFALIPGVLTDLTIPLGTLSIARPTSLVALDGDLSAVGQIATQGSEHASQSLVDAGGQPVTGATALTDVRSASSPAVPLFLPGSALTVSGITKGDRELPSQTFEVGADGSTLDDFAAWLETVAGIQDASGLPAAPGVSVEGGMLVIRGNAGEQNGLSISANDITTDNPSAPLPFNFTQNASAQGSSLFTAFTVYDSLGTPVIVHATFALESTPSTGPVWRYYLESPDNQGATRVLGTGTAQFDTEGNFVAADGNQFSLDRAGTGAASPLTFTLDLSSIHGLSTDTSAVILAEQDGFPPGTLVNYSVGQDGTINGIFSNGLSRTLGQVALGVVPNATGMVAQQDNTYVAGPNSGPLSIATPGQFGTGRVLSGALELSNVDMSREFIGLITSSTGFQASSRVITVSSDLLDQLLLIVR